MNMVNKIKEIREKDNCALISLDIKAAFDNLDRSVLSNILEFHSIKTFYRNFIFYFLLARIGVFKDDLLVIKKICHKGLLPQGSVISPNLWNLYMNQLLNSNSSNYFIQAFADKLEPFSDGRVRKELENNDNNALNMISDKLKELKLDLSIDKC
ncbi:hypothetical protein AVEN_225545-1 [Araneus ventricosus]|uniref:Reverse transcriptase domain-containing protein n=1 Tax=Araneus ventricosus TaxID=182803 RepID=A0A4Y2WGZ8_ARAVE|nr:hypothetical protein AVEN_225545-1 [Araneus ventricosus]